MLPAPGILPPPPAGAARGNSHNEDFNANEDFEGASSVRRLSKGDGLDTTNPGFGGFDTTNPFESSSNGGAVEKKTKNNPFGDSDPFAGDDDFFGDFQSG